MGDFEGFDALGGVGFKGDGADVFDLVDVDAPVFFFGVDAVFSGADDEGFGVEGGAVDHLCAVAAGWDGVFVFEVGDEDGFEVSAWVLFIGVEEEALAEGVEDGEFFGAEVSDGVEFDVAGGDALIFVGDDGGAEAAVVFAFWAAVSGGFEGFGDIFFEELFVFRKVHSKKFLVVDGVGHVISKYDIEIKN